MNISKHISFFLTLILISKLSLAQFSTGSGNITQVTTGNVGIGTPSPTTNLDVQAANPIIRAKINSGVTSYAAVYVESNTSGVNLIQLMGGQAMTGTLFGVNRAGAAQIYCNNSPLMIGTGHGYDFTLGTNATANITIKNGGNVGIGTTTPEGNLQVGTGIAKLVFGAATASTMGYGTGYLGFNASRQTAGTWTAAGDGAHNGGSIIYGNVNGDLLFSSIGNTGASTQSGITDATIVSNVKVMITSAGNLLINKTSQTNSSYRLDVNGMVRVNEIRVNLTGADFVFGRGYKLMPLKDLEFYISQNNHLPEIASAKEMETNEGVAIGEMQTKLLQKIEELTLYIIEQNKRIEALEKASQ
ncbi:MAG: hypothetical protein JWP12_1476 [Bacteroidetes bacterium]|nr:hypothetical protein [Bacteroidota bacterium]